MSSGLTFGQQLFAPAACLVVATVVQPVVIRLLRRGAVLDVPGQRSSHTVPTPRGGGIAVALGLLGGLAVADIRAWLPLAVALVGFFVIGLAEDVVGVPVRLRLAAQLLTGLLVAALLVWAAPERHWTAGLLIAGIALWITAFANAFNFMDGINGISGAHAVLAGASYAAIGAMSRDLPLVAVSTVLAAAGLAFLPWNAGRARVFLGDVGSYCLGGVMAVLAVHTALRGVPIEAVLGPLALYLVDTGWTLLRRIRRRVDWLQPHREHSYQRLCDVGWSHQTVTLATFGTGALVATLGMVSVVADPPLRIAADLVALVLLGLYLAAPVELSERATAGPGRGGLIVTYAVPGRAW